MMKKILSFLVGMQSVVGFVNFLALTLTVSLQVLTRFILMEPILWSEEVARFLLFWLVMNGAALAVIKGRHFTTELFSIDKVKNRSLRRFLQFIPALATLMVGVIMVVYGLIYTRLGSLRVVPISQINMMYVYLAIPLSGIFMVIYSVCQSITLFTMEDNT